MSFSIQNTDKLVGELVSYAAKGRREFAKWNITASAILMVCDDICVRILFRSKTGRAIYSCFTLTPYEMVRHYRFGGELFCDFLVDRMRYAFALLSHNHWQFRPRLPRWRRR